LEVSFIAQSKCDSVAEKHHKMHPEPDKLHSNRSAAVAMEGYLNYKVTHYEGKVGRLHACLYVKQSSVIVSLETDW